MTKGKIQNRVVFALLILTTVNGFSWGQPEGDINLNGSQYAYEGYDPVSYFQDTPLKGDPKWQINYEGALILFASKANKETFEKDPEKYLPQYGGYCAWAMQKGDKVKVDPQEYVIHQGRLFLNYSPSINRRFKGNLEDNIAKADQQWEGLTSSAE